jgi:transcriptional regulator of acetoin/glycerol metabolism
VAKRRAVDTIVREYVDAILKDPRQKPWSIRQAREAVDDEFVRVLWEETGGNVSVMAERAGISRMTTYSLLRRREKAAKKKSSGKRGR